MSAVHARDRVFTVLERDEKLIDVLVEASPAFEKLRSRAMRTTMAKLVTIEQAARIAGIDTDELVRRLNAALTGAEPTPRVPVDAKSPMPPPIPEALASLSPDRIVDCDVRAELRAGVEPFRRIIAAIDELPADGVLRVRALFEPAPLYAVLARRGFAYATERLASDDWRVVFYRDAAVAAPSVVATEEASTEEVIVLDVRGLEPPEPMVRTLDALAAMPRGKTLVQINVRVPQYLLPMLAERGFVYEIREQGPDLVRLFIQHK